MYKMHHNCLVHEITLIATICNKKLIPEEESVHTKFPSLHKSRGECINIANVLRARCRNDLCDEQFYSINSMCVTSNFQFIAWKILLVKKRKAREKVYKHARIMLLFFFQVF